VIYRGQRLESAPPGREYLALIVTPDLGALLEQLTVEDKARLEAWLRSDLELAAGMARNQSSEAAGILPPA
jgi:hypothetical protein